LGGSLLDKREKVRAKNWVKKEWSSPVGIKMGKTWKKLTENRGWGDHREGKAESNSRKIQPLSVLKKIGGG